MTVLKMADLDLRGKRLLIRQDLNVPMQAGEITNDKRIRAAIPTINLALKAGAKVMLMSHLGRPKEGQPHDGDINAQFTLAPVAKRLAEKLNKPVRLVTDWLAGIDINDGEVVLCENVRFHLGEKKNDPVLAQKMARLCDIFVMDAFGTAHRAQASTHGVAQYANTACAGPLLVAELDALTTALDNPARPMVAIVGGSKVSTKLPVLDSLVNIVDHLIVGGGIANTFIAAAGFNVGQSLFEPDLVEKARHLAELTRSRGGEIPIPVDVVCAKELATNATATLKAIDKIENDDKIFDIGPQTAAQLAEILKHAGTIVWNGPVGIFEHDQFGAGTETLAKAIADSSAFSIAGGGDTLAAVDKYGISDKISYISTGGGAFLEFLQGKVLPAVAILEQRANDV